MGIIIPKQFKQLFVICLIALFHSPIFASETDDYDARIRSIIVNENISEKSKMEQILKISIQQNGRYPKYSHELFRGTPKWSHHIKTFFTDQVIWNDYFSKINSTSTPCANNELFEIWYRRGGDVVIIKIFQKYGYIDDYGFFKRKSAKISQKHQALILKSIQPLFDQIYDSK